MSPIGNSIPRRDAAEADIKRINMSFDRKTYPSIPYKQFLVKAKKTDKEQATSYLLKAMGVMFNQMEEK